MCVKSSKGIATVLMPVKELKLCKSTRRSTSRICEVPGKQKTHTPTPTQNHQSMPATVDIAPQPSVCVPWLLPARKTIAETTAYARHTRPTPQRSRSLSSRRTIVRCAKFGGVGMEPLLTSIRNLLRSNMRHASTDITFCPAETPAKHETDTGA